MSVEGAIPLQVANVSLIVKQGVCGAISFRMDYSIDPQRKGASVNRVNVVSRNIAAIGYSTETGTLEILFRSGGIYQYFNVPARVYSALMSSSSKGGYFAQHIKNIYRCVQIR